MLKRDHASAAVGCGCGSSDYLLHNIRHRGSIHRLCTSCVLRFHLGSFCPVCLQLFRRSPPADYIKCSKCPSFSHTSCVRQGTATASYVCACCLNPNHLRFEVRPDGDLIRRSIDSKSAKALLAAGQIASLSMTRAAAAARAEAERKARESAVARKRAREALERVAVVASKGREFQSVAEGKKKSRASSADVSVSPQKRIHNRKPGGEPKTGALRRLGIQETVKLVGMQGKDALGGSASVSEHHNFQDYVTMAQREKHVMQGAKRKKQLISGASLSGSPQNHCFQGRHVIADDGDKSKGVAYSGPGPGPGPGPAQLLSSKKDAMVSKTNPRAIITGSTASLMS